jgi:hypothetical protein
MDGHLWISPKGDPIFPLFFRGLGIRWGIDLPLAVELLKSPRKRLICIRLKINHLRQVLGGFGQLIDYQCP